MSDQINSSSSNVQPANTNLPTESHPSAAAAAATTTTTYRQTFGKCQRCGKYEKRTMHMQCHHITCCLTCAKECKTCPHPQCGLPVVGQKNRHFAVYACYTPVPDIHAATSGPIDENESNGESEAGEAAEPERESVMEDERDNINSSIIDAPTTNDNENVNNKKDPKDELYLLTSTTKLGICCVCLEGEARCFILCDDENGSACGHDVCVDCVNKFYDCPVCRQKIISYLEVRDF